MKIYKYLDYITELIYRKLMRFRLKKKNFSIVSNDCWGGSVYLDLGISEFNILPTAYSTIGFKNSEEQVKNKVVGHRNKSLLPSNTSGYKGVHYENNGWVASWVENGIVGKNKFKNKEDAIEHRKQMVELHYSKEHYIDNR
jgi:hypothetical protein